MNSTKNQSTSVTGARKLCLRPEAASFVTGKAPHDCSTEAEARPLTDVSHAATKNHHKSGFSAHIPPCKQTNGQMLRITHDTRSPMRAGQVNMTGIPLLANGQTTPWQQMINIGIIPGYEKDVVSTSAGHIKTLPEDIDMVIYHAGCIDGFAAAVAAWLLLGTNAEYIAYGHSSSVRLPDVRGRKVALLDFCFSKTDMQSLYLDADAMVILDHHQSAEQDLVSIPEDSKVFEMRQSGATLAWNYFHGSSGASMPLLFRYIEDKDIWRWRHHNSKELSAAINILPFEFEVWRSLLDRGDEGVRQLISKGQAILEYTNHLVTRHCERSTLRRMRLAPEYVALVVNGSCLASEIGNELAEAQDVDFGFIWWFDHKRRMFRVSLRSATDECSVNTIAQHFGGGGHPRAAGFAYQGASIEELFVTTPVGYS